MKTKLTYLILGFALSCGVSWALDTTSESYINTLCSPGICDLDGYMLQVGTAVPYNEEWGSYQVVDSVIDPKLRKIILRMDRYMDSKGFEK